MLKLIEDDKMILKEKVEIRELTLFDLTTHVYS